MTTSIEPSNDEYAALPNIIVDRYSPIPFYFQLAKFLQSEIESDRWKPGQRIASEPALGDHFNVSRSTVRQALQILESEGWIAREKGRGTFVATTRARSWLLQSAEGFFAEEVRRLGRTVTSRILRAAVEPLPPWASEALKLPSESQGVTLERLRAVDGGTAMYVVNHLPEELAGDDPLPRRKRVSLRDAHRSRRAQGIRSKAET